MLTASEMERFREAVRILEERSADFHLGDENADHEPRTWFDGSDDALDRTERGHATSGEWFFITTIQGR